MTALPSWVTYAMDAFTLIMNKREIQRRRTVEMALVTEQGVIQQHGRMIKRWL
jgi:hypothetical protein